MEDLAICKRIAEIEGHWWVTDRGCYLYIMKEYAESKDHPLPTYYNPLTDDALCFQLMVKYKVYVDYFGDNARAAMSWNGSDREFQVDVVDMSMNKAILLAIIEAHKES